MSNIWRKPMKCQWKQWRGLALNLVVLWTCVADNSLTVYFESSGYGLGKSSFLQFWNSWDSDCEEQYLVDSWESEKNHSQYLRYISPSQDLYMSYNLSQLSKNPQNFLGNQPQNLHNSFLSGQISLILKRFWLIIE